LDTTKTIFGPFASQAMDCSVIGTVGLLALIVNIASALQFFAVSPSWR